MSFATVYSRAHSGMEAPPVTIEVHISYGLPKLSIVGLPETTIKESKDRVRSALINAGFEFPSQRITINLAPADLPKEGSLFDLPIAIGILCASGQIKPQTPLTNYEFAGELGLSGSVRPIPGALPIAVAARNAQRTLIIAENNANHAARVRDAIVLAAPHLLSVCAHLNNTTPLTPHTYQAPAPPKGPFLDLSDIYGQTLAKRALEISAAGRHHFLMVGPPGSGKSMLAQRLPTLLPPMSETESLAVATLQSLCEQPECNERPFYAPHHTASVYALVGGGNPPAPGAVSRAHHGVLFLDELPEFSSKALEGLREPLESGHITIARAAYTMRLPCQFQLIGAMNPCPCGYKGSKNQLCRCNAQYIQNYQRKCSGPLMDRIDLHLAVSMPTPAELKQTGEKSSVVKKRVENAHHIQQERAQKHNSRLNGQEINAHCVLEQKAQSQMNRWCQEFGISIRGRQSILKVARTIADLAGETMIHSHHLDEALQYRKA